MPQRSRKTQQRFNLDTTPSETCLPGCNRAIKAKHMQFDASNLALGQTSISLRDGLERRTLSFLLSEQGYYEAR
jgi:hypothetical protein